MVEVLVNDSGSPSYEEIDQYFADIDAWAQQYCPSYLGYTVNDISDVSLLWDCLGCYQFSDDKCANWFKLKWL